MIWFWIKFIPLAWAFFAVVIAVVPLIVSAVSALKFMANGGDISDYDWDDNDHIAQLSHIYTEMFSAYDFEDVAKISLFAILLFGIGWPIGIPFIIYFWMIIDKRVKKDRYDRTIKQADEDKREREKDLED